jgi:large subunit ribosomal protein L9
MARVLLRSDIAPLGHRGDLVEVADGYARNYLYPKGLAVKASVGIEQQAARMRRARELKSLHEREAAQSVAERLAASTITIEARVGKSGRLFGSVGVQDIVSALSAQHGIELSRRQVLLQEPIKSAGVREVPLDLHPEVHATIRVEVVAAS